jgi:hypothetical protein
LHKPFPAALLFDALSEAFSKGARHSQNALE